MNATNLAKLGVALMAVAIVMAAIGHARAETCNTVCVTRDRNGVCTWWDTQCTREWSPTPERDPALRECTRICVAKDRNGECTWWSEECR